MRQSLSERLLESFDFTSLAYQRRRKAAFEDAFKARRINYALVRERRS